VGASAGIPINLIYLVRNLFPEPVEPSMIVLVVLSCWILVLAFVSALCVAAGRGEAQNAQASSVIAWDEIQESAGGAHVGARRGRTAEPAGRLLGAGGATG
jgi:hypothetical protein